jgi:arylsulfatase A-like enzyme
LYRRSCSIHHRPTAIRTGMTTVGQAGAPLGLPAEACTLATVLKSLGYATGQFGKNHLGDQNQFLPTVHGFDEFFGYLYHLDAMEDPAHHGYPQELLNVVGPRNAKSIRASGFPRGVSG